ncbi:MAG: quinohemoprotein amine dehydrogenase subunit beta [Hyphomicrobiales bacterium]
MGRFVNAFRGTLLGAAFALTALSGSAEAKDYLLTGIKPDKLVLVDAESRKVERVYEVPNSKPGLGVITPSPDGKVAYALVNRWESVSGIDLDSGKEVFRADMSSGEERVKSVLGMDVSPDGSELAVFQSPVKLMPGEFEIQPTRIAIYDTSSGINAKPMRVIPAPRQVTLVTYSTDGSRLYLLGRSVHVVDAKTGDILETHKTQGWDRPNFHNPDVLDVWSQWEQAATLSTPYYTVRKDKALDDPEAYVTGILTVDLNSGEFTIKDVENTAVFYFSSVVNPVRRNEVYGVYNTLAKFDLNTADTMKSVKSISLDHSYYAINVSSDGKELYIGGTLGDIAVYSTETLERTGTIKMPGDANMGIAALRVIKR